MFTSRAFDECLNFDIWVVAIRAAMSIKFGFCETSRAGQSSACDTTTWVLDGLCVLLPDLHQHLRPHVLVQDNCKLSLGDIKLCYLLLGPAEQCSVDAECQESEGNGAEGDHYA